ncbi:YHYH protein [Salinibacterium sp. SWN167]|uniref:YHYH protein n=1 Tax=Salinibacterium sp. SWN167 TaxID=2792054 RepID=UPI0018CF4AB3|nr:YHYH protein [Salinibacterium sp. SWN167]MBH0083751.1 YHYH protein [Salinibacterium sp. SWN167]
MNNILGRALRHKRSTLLVGAVVMAVLATAACSAVDATDSASTETAAVTTGIDLALFADDAIVGDPETVDCTLSGGTETTCYEITISGYPSTYEVGPFCPATTETSADDAGIWFDGDAVYDLDGEFIANLAETYGDDGWKMYDEDGNVYVTDTVEAFEAAARPDVDPEYQNYCIEGSLDFLDGGDPIESTVLIPTTPVVADSASATSGNSGITLDGIVIAEPAPVDAILGAYTIASFDDCGGHFNPFEGYHLHGSLGCGENGDASDDETAIFGYAMDGFAVHSAYTEEQLANVELDECNGHTTEEDGYHYHANSAEKNQVLECFIGETVAGDEAAGGPPADAPAGGPPAGEVPGEEPNE